MRSATLRARNTSAPVLFAGAAALLCAASANAAIRIEFTGMNLIYDGSAFYDAGSSAGGLADPADADPLVSVDFFNDDTLVGSLSSDISLDVYIPDVTGLSASPGAVTNLTTPGNPGFFDLLMGTSPLASEFLLLDLNAVNVTYVDVSGIAQFVFAASIASSSAQNLPFGLVVADPVFVSFSAQVTPGSITTSDDIITGFEAFGTGEFNASAIPAPTTAAALGLGALAALRRRRNA
jgi:hypothetical protein